MRKKVHLVCNAHLDPVWLWTWKDGLTEAMSTFRTAADFCERRRGFVFNHNEAILYGWIEEHDPELFARIRALVKKKRWHIAGGSYLQPDVNTPSGEAHIRQFLYGKEYFRSRFAVEPTTAYNFDSFGHAEGYQQILAGCGFDSYIFCRPDYGTWDLPVGAFQWKGRSGKSVIARRSDDHYLSNGEIYGNLEKWLPHFENEPEIMILWGIGNHGGGVSAAEYREIERFIKNRGDEYEIIHSTPERFFRSVKRYSRNLPVVEGELQNSYPGCYTSMARLKRSYRPAENLVTATERLAAVDWWRGNRYPKGEHDAAFGFIFGRGFKEAVITKKALVFNTGPQVLVHFPGSRGRGRGKKTAAPFSLTVSASNVIVSALKKAEHGNCLIVRLQELAGRKTKVRLDVRPFRHPIETEIDAYGLKTLKIRPGSGNPVVREVNLIER